MRTIGGLIVAVCIGAIISPQASAPGQSAPEHAALPIDHQTLTDAQRLFYNARYEAAGALALGLRVPDIDELANDELRSSALLFQLKALLEQSSDKDRALKDCATCPDLIAAFLADVHRGQNTARMTLQSNAGDEAALFFLGKLDLNYVWLQLGPLHRRTGWDEYLGSETVARCGAQTESAARSSTRRTRVDRLHRRHENAVGLPLAARRRQSEAGPGQRS